MQLTLLRCLGTVGLLGRLLSGCTGHQYDHHRQLGQNLQATGDKTAGTCAPVLWGTMRPVNLLNTFTRRKNCAQLGCAAQRTAETPGFHT